MESTTVKFEPNYSDLEISISKVFDAPIELVYKAFTDPALIPKWWGPAKYITTVDTMDFKPGGKWRYVQGNEQEGEFAFHGEYLEITAPIKIVSTFEYEGMPGHIITDTMTLEDLNGKTRVTTVSKFANAEDKKGMLDMDMESGAVESWVRFAEVLKSL